jgi:hypothetical protein
METCPQVEELRQMLVRSVWSVFICCSVS